MPLDKSATQTTATNSATYLVNKRRRVFATGASGAAGCGTSAPAAPGRFEARKYLAKSRTLIASTVPNVGPSSRPSLRDDARSFNHLVRPCEQHRRHIESQCIGSLQIDHQFELGRRLQGKIARISALQDPVDVGCGAAEDIAGIDAVGNQTAARSKHAQWIDCGQAVARCQRNDQITMADGEGIRQDDQAAGLLGSEISDGALELAIVVSHGSDWLDAKGRGRILDHAYEGSGKWRRVRVEEERDALDGRGDLLERFQPFSAHREFEIEESGDVAARPRHTGDEAAAERINDVHQQDWDGVRFLHERGYRRRGHADNEVGHEIDQLPSECAHLSGPANAPTKFDAEVTAFRPAQLFQPLLQSRNASLRLRISRRKPAQHCNPPHSVRRLGYRTVRRKQPSSHTANKRDELAPPHSRTSLARATNTSDKETPSNAAAFRLTAM